MSCRPARLRSRLPCNDICAMIGANTTTSSRESTMSMLSTLAGALEGAPNAGNGTSNGINLGGIASSGALISEVISLIQNRPGGLGGLLQSFQQAEAFWRAETVGEII